MQPNETRLLHAIASGPISIHTTGASVWLPPAAKLDSGGQLVLNHAASEMLGNPDRVLVRVNPGQAAIRLQPTTPGDLGGFALSGGGNAQCRISAREMARRYPGLIGDYRVSKASSGVLLTKLEDDD